MHEQIRGNSARIGSEIGKEKGKGKGKGKEKGSEPHLFGPTSAVNVLVVVERRSKS